MTARNIRALAPLEDGFRVLREDHAPADADLEGSLTMGEIRSLDEPQWIAEQAAYFADMATWKKAQASALERVQRYPRLIATQRPPSKWPMRLLVGSMALTLCAVLVLAWYVARAVNPALPSQGATAEAPGSPRKPAEAGQGRANGAMVAKRLPRQP